MLDTDFSVMGKGYHTTFKGWTQLEDSFALMLSMQQVEAFKPQLIVTIQTKRIFNAVKADADFVLMIVNDKSGRSGKSGKKSPTEVEVYLVPMFEVEQALRNSWSHRVKSTGGENGPVSLMFRDGQNDYEYGYQCKFADFYIGSADAAHLSNEFNAKHSLEIQPLDIDQAKAGLSKKFGIPIEAITISISV